MNRKLIVLILVSIVALSALSFNGANVLVDRTNYVPYNSTGTFNGSVTIYSNGSINAGGTYYPASGVNASGVLDLSGNTYTQIENINGGITILRNSTVLNGNGLTTNGSCVSLVGVTGVSVFSTVVTNSLFGVDVGASSSFASVYANSFVNDSIGVYVLNSNNITVTNNSYQAANGKYFLESCTSDYINVTYNTADLGSYTGRGIFTFGGQNIYLADNMIKNAFIGIYESSATNVQMVSNSFLNESLGTAICSVNSNDVTINNATVTNYPGYSLFLCGDSYVSIYNADLNGSANGVVVKRSNYVSISNSDMSNSTSSHELVICGSTHVNLVCDVFNASALGLLQIQIEGSSFISMSHISVYDPFSLPAICMFDVKSVSLNDSVVAAVDGVLGAPDSCIVNPTFSNNTFRILGNNGYAIYFTCLSQELDDMSVTANTFITNSSTSGAYGIELTCLRSSFSPSSPYALFNLTVSGNSFMNVEYPVDICSTFLGELVTIDNNNIQNAFSGISLYNCGGFYQQVSVVGNNLTNIGYFGMDLDYSHSIIVSNNTVTNTRSWAIGLCSDQGVIFSGNVVYNQNEKISIGINTLLCLGESINAVVSGNRVYSNHVDVNNSSYDKIGIGVDCGVGVSLYGNYVSNATVGISECCYNNGSIFANTVVHSKDGMIMFAASHSQLFDNVVTDSNTSLSITYSSNLTIYANTLDTASYSTLFVGGSNDLTFYHNNFLNGSHVTVLLFCNNNLNWNLSLPTGGNYWSNYTGSGSDGIGTTPYSINANNTDYLPLTSMWSEPSILFSEVGLPLGTIWSVDLNGTTISSAMPTISFQVTQGQYVTEAYAVSDVYGFKQPVNGTVTVSSSNTTVTIEFLPTTYLVSFTETGMPAGQTWSVSLNGVTEKSTGPGIEFNVTNGTYSYSVATMTGFEKSGTVIVDGAQVSVTVAFPQLYTLTVNETGLTAGSTWTFYLQGVEFNSSSTSLQVQVAAGSYLVYASGPSGYSVSIQSSSLTISNNSALQVTFTNLSSSGGVPSKTNSAGIYEGLGIGAVVGVVAGVLAMMFYSGTGAFRRLKKNKP